MLTDYNKCLRCQKPLDHAKSTWLELSFKTGLYAESVPAEESQGSFEFGSACAKAILKNGGNMVCVGVAARKNK